MPSHSFHDNSVCVRQGVSVVEVREAVVAYDCIDLHVSPLLDVWIQGHREEERLYCRNRLHSETGLIYWERKCVENLSLTVSAPPITIKPIRMEPNIVIKTYRHTQQRLRLLLLCFPQLALDRSLLVTFLLKSRQLKEVQFPSPWRIQVRYGFSEIQF